MKNIIWGYTHIGYNNIMIRYDLQTNDPTIAACNIPKNKKKKTDIIIHPSKEQFIYGNCASVAICSAFGIEYRAFKTICSLLKMDISEGFDFFECKKLINLLSKHYNILVQYTPNYGKVKYYQMLLLLNKGKYIVMFHNHLSYAENGEVFDGYYQGSEKAKFYIPTGWWRIIG